MSQQTNRDINLINAARNGTSKQCRFVYATEFPICNALLQLTIQRADPMWFVVLIWERIVRESFYTEYAAGSLMMTHKPTVTQIVDGKRTVASSSVPCLPPVPP